MLFSRQSRTAIWKRAFTFGEGQKPRLCARSIHESARLISEIKKAEHGFGRPRETPVVSGFEAAATTDDHHRLQQPLLKGCLLDGDGWMSR